MSASFYDLLKYAATGQASPSMTYFDKLRASTLMGGTVQTLTGQPPLSFKSDGSPIIVWSMKGNTQQTGTPSPQNIITPKMYGARTANVMPFAAAQTITSNGITFTSDGKGGYTVKGRSTAYAIAVFQLSDTFIIPNSVGNGGNGTLSFWNTKADSITFGFMFNGTAIDEWSMNAVNRQNNAYRLLAGQTCNAIRMTLPSSMSCDQKIQPEFTDNGEYPTDFEPYGYKIPITNAGQTTPVYLGEVPTVRRVRKFVLDGTEDIVKPYNQSVYRFSIDGYMRNQNNIPVCSHYSGRATVSGAGDLANNEIAFLLSQSGNNYMYIRDDARTDVADFKSYLAAQYAAGTPVTVWYVLATPETAIVNEPLCKIGTYADEMHSEDAGVSIPTAKGQNTLTVDTDLQPSEMTITYRG